ncbi:LpqB family beta-propeller domain-containing protein [Streptomyces sp. 6N223]|uniref:LpqB family beta-propeller domain-containing protein n=1 Tax=Streptomyces sp. 6N223 TaxID=3457412 RepID=UPI003FD2019B
MRAERGRAAGGRLPLRGRRRRGTALLTAAGLLLAGCASMPGSGPVQRVESSQRADGDGESQTRVFGVPPEERAQPQEIVSGFLEAVTSDEAGFDTAKQYLTPERREEWDPFLGISVLSAGPTVATPVSETSLDGSGETVLVGVSGTQLAAVDSSQVYVPHEGDYQTVFELRQVRGEWRIDSMPEGLVMREADFRRNYRSVNAYYYADLGPETGRVANGDKVLVADPVYVRKRIGTIEEVVASLLNGPSDWLGPAVRTAFPPGVSLADGGAPEIDESGTLTVRLAGVPREWSEHRCERMGAQLRYSVQELATVDVGDVRIANPAGTQLCLLTADRAEQYAPGLLDGEARRAYFIDEEHRLVSVSEDPAVGRTTPVSGPMGRGEVELEDAAVARGEDWAAGVSADGMSLYVAPLSGGEVMPEPVYARAAVPEGDEGLTAPSWDGLGDLWFADRDPAGQRLLRLPSGRGTPQEIPVRGLRDEQRIEAVRVASDGVRIAMLVREDDRTTLLLGRVERTEGATGEGSEVVVGGLRSVAPQLESVAAASWAGDSRLVVVGRPADGVEQWQFVTTDGSLATTPTVPGLNDVTGVAAAEDEDKPLLAETEDGIARLEDDAQWRLVAPENESGPFYPG